MRSSTHRLALTGDRSLHLTSMGSGRDVVLIHGALTTGSDWLVSPVTKLVDAARLLVIDRPGHGASRRSRFEGSPRAQATQIHEGLRSFGVRRPILVAHSLGALVALAVAELHPDDVAGLVLVAPLAFPEIRPLEHSLYAPRAAPVVGPFLSWAMSKGPDRLALQQIHQLMFSPEAPPSEWKRNYPWDWMLSAEGGTATGEDFSAIFPLSPAAAIRPQLIDVPVHIVAGTADVVVRPELHAQPLARMLQRGTLTLLRGAGHMPHHMNATDVCKAVRSLLIDDPQV